MYPSKQEVETGASWLVRQTKSTIAWCHRDPASVNKRANSGRRELTSAFGLRTQAGMCSYDLTRAYALKHENVHRHILGKSHTHTKQTGQSNQRQHSFLQLLLILNTFTVVEFNPQMSEKKCFSTFSSV